MTSTKSLPTKPRPRRYQKAVAAGFALLTKRKPTWRNLVDVTRLDLGNGFSCILGEVYGDYETGGSKVFRTSGWERETAAAYGFNTPAQVSGDYYDYQTERRQMRALTAEWKRQLREAA